MNPLLKSRSRKLRKQSTEAEKCLWYHLRGRRLNHCRFKRQYVIGQYIVDFVCLHKKLIIELDGGQHASQQEYDLNRTNFLESQGFRVIRFWNNQLLQEKDNVLVYLFNLLEK